MVAYTGGNRETQAGYVIMIHGSKRRLILEVPKAAEHAAVILFTAHTHVQAGSSHMTYFSSTPLNAGSRKYAVK
jgi:hypothetical protein